MMAGQTRLSSLCGVSRMPMSRGVKLQPGEKLSSVYPGLIDRGDGRFREPYEYRGKQSNRYYEETSCAVCGQVTLAHASNIRKYARSVCSAECKRKHRTKPDGAVKFKRGRAGGHVLEKAASHPYAKKGFVAQHRLVVERHIGRVLAPHERVHHINCIQDDNRIENLHLCTSVMDHNSSHASLNKCVAALLEDGTLIFDRNTGEYRVRT